MDGWTLGLLVDYIYTAEIQVTEDNVQVILQAAGKVNSRSKDAYRTITLSRDEACLLRVCVCLTGAVARGRPAPAQ